MGNSSYTLSKEYAGMNVTVSNEQDQNHRDMPWALS